MAKVSINKKAAHAREGMMCVVTGAIELSSRGNADLIKITAEVADVVRQADLRDGTVTLFVPGATCALTTLEFESGVLQDVQEMLDNIVPPDKNYVHNHNLGDGNGHSHVRAGLVGPSLAVPFTNGKLTLGIWQEIIFCDFDNRPRDRQIVVQVMGV